MAPGIATRLDGLPTRLFTLSEAVRPTAAVKELGQVYLMAKAYRRQEELPPSLVTDARQAAGWSLTREVLLCARRLSALSVERSTARKNWRYPNLVSMELSPNSSMRWLSFRGWVPALMAAALIGQDLQQWAAAQDIALICA